VYTDIEGLATPITRRGKAFEGLRSALWAFPHKFVVYVGWEEGGVSQKEFGNVAGERRLHPGGIAVYLDETWLGEVLSCALGKICGQPTVEAVLRSNAFDGVVWL
jgi:hypothetical protein